MSDRAVCVHLHCYQPPRENPWTGLIEPEWSAFPHRDWNERITAECYRPNGAAHVLAHDGTLLDVIDNYEQTSWDVGPTLHSWLERHAPDVDRALRDADRRAARRGAAPAVAAPAIHAILPLARPHDADVLVAWGLADFERRFARRAEGFWLPECAVDTTSLEILARRGVAYTVLVPEQAARVRTPGGAWHAVTPDELDTTVPYRVLLPSGRSITVFFAHGPISRAIAFDGLLHNGEAFATAMEAAFRAGSDAQLLSVVTDGETFGHHHRHGEMALAWALRSLQQRDVRITTFGAHLRAYPAALEVELHEPSAWSCAHGVERWRSDCGCVTGGEPGWNQAWRAPLRAATDWLCEQLDAAFTEHAAAWFTDRDAALEAYGAVVCGQADPASFLAAHAPGARTPEDRTQALRLLEARRHGFAATTSCAWFFADPDGIETGITLLHAARAAELLREATGAEIERGFVDRIAPMRSNHPGPAAGAGHDGPGTHDGSDRDHRFGDDGRRLWTTLIGEARTAPARLAAAAAVLRAAHATVPAQLGEWDLEPAAPGTAITGVTDAVLTHRPTLARHEFALHASTRRGDALAVHGEAVGALPAPEARAVATLAEIPVAAGAVATRALLGLPQAGAPAAWGTDGINGAPVALRALASHIRDHGYGPGEHGGLLALLSQAAPIDGEVADAAREAVLAARDAHPSYATEAEFAALAEFLRRLRVSADRQAPAAVPHDGHTADVHIHAVQPPA